MASKIHLLLIDDDKYFRIGVKDQLRDLAIFTEAGSMEEAINILNGQNHFDLILVDMEMEIKTAGIKVLEKAKKLNIHSIVLSSQQESEIIEKAYIEGCNHFLSKTHYATHLRPYIEKFIKQNFSGTDTSFFNTKYITQDERLTQRVQEVAKINLRNRCVFITGETGVGKTILGEFFHEQTYNSKAPFIHINCSEIPENLIESELFGHTKGSFTGANEDKKGKLEEASGGTLFLDEIGTMSLGMQQKILNAIESKSFTRIGSSKVIKSEFTLITATCEDLIQKIANGEFRKDLFYRISGINLEIPALHERRNDIPLLINHFLNLSPRKAIIKEDAVSLLQSLRWEGNIRELKKAVEVLILKSKGIIRREDIKPPEQIQLGPEFLSADQKEFIQNNGLKEFINKVEQEVVNETLKKHDGKITKAIKELQISTSAFYRILNQITHSN